MKKLVLILSATFSSISAFANEDFASNEAYSNNFTANNYVSGNEFTANNELANDEILAQTFADGANKEIAALSTEEMQNTKGASMPEINTGTLVGNTLRGMGNGAVWSTVGNALERKIFHGEWPTLESTGYAALAGAAGGAIGGAVIGPVQNKFSSELVGKVASGASGYIYGRYIDKNPFNPPTERPKTQFEIHNEQLEQAAFGY